MANQRAAQITDLLAQLDADTLDITRVRELMNTAPTNDGAYCRALCYIADVYERRHNIYQARPLTPTPAERADWENQMNAREPGVRRICRQI